MQTSTYHLLEPRDPGCVLADYHFPGLAAKVSAEDVVFKTKNDVSKGRTVFCKEAELLHRGTPLRVHIPVSGR